MKTLTEISGSVIRVAAAAIAEARRSLPAEEKPAAALPAQPQGAGAEAGDAPAQAPAPVDAPPDDAAATAPPADAGPDAEGGAAKEAIDAAVAKATGLSGDRLTMVQGAVEAAGRRAAEVRLVRVFGPEDPVPGATRVGAYQYVVDLFPAKMTQDTAPRNERGRRGGGRGGGGGGRGGGDRGAKASGVGGFSMDSLREDRKSERGGRGGPGGGRRSSPGGRGSGPGGPGGGAPKK